MEAEKKLPVKVSEAFNFDLDDIYQFGVDTFGLHKAELYENEIWKLIENLSRKWIPIRNRCYLM